ncbi:putative variant surface glycoprotein [Trypanosoma theileri]|uniref:Putative variant surface glycoprotein n=1 Tax=Trypanosoma theileri TaxID=67003 RepID=A0A1X0P3E4_9TRYP|nr:putative variant surface glycoprotein [Trypanosoma theileri]ORC91405.1 putative variant surface glycoprotein [Trypanosoma theileri]
MLNLCRVLLKVQSHQKVKSQHPNAGTRFGRVYNRGFIRYGFGGFGMSVYTPKKDRRFRVLTPPPPKGDLFADNESLVPTTRTLSPNFRAFALEDGGVLFTHPTHEQIMRWGQGVLTEEGKATGMTSMDNYVNSRIQSIIAENTVENVAISHWRRRHMWNLIKAHGKLQRRWGVSDTLKGARSNIYGRS